MRGNSDGEGLDTLVQFRASETTIAFLDDLVDAWNLDSRSDALRVIIHSWAGLLGGNFWAVTDPERLSEEWGDVGSLLASAHGGEEGMPEPLNEARLLDVMADVPILLGAAESELGLHPPDSGQDTDTGELPNMGGRE